MNHRFYYSITIIVIFIIIIIIIAVIFVTIMMMMMMMIVLVVTASMMMMQCLGWKGAICHSPINLENGPTKSVQITYMYVLLRNGPLYIYVNQKIKQKCRNGPLLMGPMPVGMTIILMNLMLLSMV